MVLDILLFAKERELTVRPVDPAELVRETVKTILPKARDCGVEFVTESDEGLSTCNLDPGFLRTALVNIIENAVEACLENKNAKAHKVVFRVSQDPSWLIFSVRDDGKGMDRETKDRMFDLFFSSKGGKGTGLGMYITDRIVRQHGGEIEVDSEPGRGTVIELRIPRDLAADELESKNLEVEGPPALAPGRTPA
jgi:signal transduction histidine kinase